MLTGAYMGRALSVLWSGAAGPARARIPEMAVGFGVLVALAVVLGVVFGPLERLLGAETAEVGLIVPALGLGAGLSGLLLGWFIAPRRLLGIVFNPARGGFTIAGGMDRLVLRPALAVAADCERLEQLLWFRRADTEGLDGLIFGLMRRMIAGGNRARRLQSGLIHRELAITVVGIALIAVVLLAAPLYS